MFGSQSLHSTASYFDLLNATVDQCRVGFYSLIQALHDLVDRTCPQNNRNNQKGCNIAIIVILVMLVMCFEVPLLKDVFNIGSMLNDMKDEEVGEKNNVLINN